MRAPAETITPALPEPVELQVDGSARVLTHISELDQLLTAKTAISDELLAGYSALNDRSLSELLRDTQASSDRIHKTLTRILGSPDLADFLLNDFDRTFFSTENGWQELMLQVMALDANYQEPQMLSLAKYRKFLSHQMDSLALIASERNQNVPLEAGEEVRSLVRCDEATKMGAVPQSRRNRGATTELVRLVRGDVARLVVECDYSLEVCLCNRRFLIDYSGAPALIDPGGRVSQLKDGPNLVGRSSSSDVVIRAKYQNVSRSHLVINVSGGQPVSLTDVSSGGTYIPKGRISLNQEVV